MKYWFFDGNDVVGPFAPTELAAHKAFGETSLICPENFSDDGDHWQPATLFAEIQELLRRRETEIITSSETLEEEMDTLLKQRSPLSFDEEPMEGPQLQIPAKPAKPGPIEDYFNHIKEEDLGDILGMPDPNDNSDMDLAHALEKQLANTTSTRRKKQPELAQGADEQTVQRLEATHHIATATEVFGSSAPESDQTPTLPPLPSATMPIVALEKPAAQPANDDLTPLNVQAMSSPSAQQTPAQTHPPHTAAPHTKQEETPGVIPDPALLRAERVEVNSVRARLKQTQEMKDFLHETQSAHIKNAQQRERKTSVMLLAALSIVGALLLTLQFSRSKQAAPVTAAPVAQTHAQELLNEPDPVVPTPPPAAVTPTDEQKALEIVKNYPLSGGRGSLANYLQQIYKTQLAQGYQAAWAAEPLYKNTYVVKYRLTKTRKEPIIYIFQVDVATQKLTGALNNISLDLVGKI